MHAPSSASRRRDRKSTRLNSSHVAISYAVFCLKKKKRAEFFAGFLPSVAPRNRYAVRLAVAGGAVRSGGYQPERLDHDERARRGDVFFFNDTATTEIYTLSLHDALPI